MEDKRTFITHLEQLIQQKQMGKAIESTLDFLDLRPETYLRDAAMKLSGRWGVMNDAIEDKLVDTATEQAYFQEIKSSLDHLKDLINQEIQEEQGAQANLPTLPKLPQPDFTKLLFDHSLRPAFTEKIAKTLFLQRTSVNLYGEDGTGKRRVFVDMQKAFRNVGFDEYTPIVIDFKNFAYKYAGMLREIHHQLGGQGEMFAHFSDFFKEIEQQNRWYVLVLEHFDTILDNPKIDPYFNPQFFDDLNYLKNKRNVALVVHTQQPHRGSFVFVEGKAYSNSWLNLKMEPMPPLTDIQVQLELRKRLSDDYFTWLYANPHERSQVERKIQETPHTYQMLCFLAEQLNSRADEELRFDKRLDKWQKRYDLETKTSALKKAENAKNKATMWSAVTGIKVSLKDLTSLWKSKPNGKKAEENKKK
ncbi:hypothetical protein BKI52_10360 [marine bacterium AO1-C]|nr:hypothetical protein BKI52_10360 [marine bacterium AO1-C]